VRFLLDAHLSHRKIASPLRKRGHDVRALQEERVFDGLHDDEVLALATSENRIVITRNSRHFGPLTRRWVEEGRSHAGCILIWSYEHDEYAEIIHGVEQVISRLPRQGDWRDIVMAI